MNSQDIRLLLRNQKRYKENVKKLQDEIEVYRAKASKVTASYDNKGGSNGRNTSSKVENNVIKIQQYEDTIRKLNMLIECGDKYLNRLKLYQRVFVEDCVVNGISYQEVALREDTSYENVKKIVDNALKKLEKV